MFSSPHRTHARYLSQRRVWMLTKLPQGQPSSGEQHLRLRSMTVHQKVQIQPLTVQEPTKAMFSQTQTPKQTHKTLRRQSRSQKEIEAQRQSPSSMITKTQVTRASGLAPKKLPREDQIRSMMQQTQPLRARSLARTEDSIKQDLGQESVAAKGARRRRRRRKRGKR